jgi:succinylarginine dihydrolase
MTTLSTPTQIEGARLLTLRSMLMLEMKGMKRSRSPSAYSMLKQMGFKGSREKVLAQMDEIRNQLLGESK